MPWFLRPSTPYRRERWITAGRGPIEGHVKATWLQLGLGEGRTEPAAEGGIILSSEELRLPGTETYRLDLSEERREMSVLMA